VYSHPQALAQCRNYLQKNHLDSIETYDTAGSVKLIKEKKMMNEAAIASKLAADLYDMKILDQGIEDRKNNFTRFLVLSQTDTNIRAKKTRTRKELSSSKVTEWNEKDIFNEKKDYRQATGQNKTSIIFSVNHVPGALFGILKEFASRKINLTKIESRPTKETPWEYNFYMDFEGHVKDKSVKETLQSIKEKTSFVKILGSYKRAEFH